MQLIDFALCFYFKYGKYFLYIKILHNFYISRNIIYLEVVRLTVYLDILFFVNFTVNSVILLLCIRLSGLKVKFLRILISGLIGAFYGIAVYLSWGKPLNNGAFKLLVSAMMVIIATGRVGFKKFFYCLIMLYAVSFICSGALMALVYLKGESIFGGVKYINLLLSLLVSAITVFCILYVKAKKALREVKKIKVCVNGKEVNLNALVDTGNMLTEPISGMPVAIVEGKALNNIIGDGHNLKIRLIPYKSLGCDCDMLTGFIPDSFTVDKANVKCCVAIYNGKLSSACEYEALIPPKLV